MGEYWANALTPGCITQVLFSLSYRLWKGYKMYIIFLVLGVKRISGSFTIQSQTMIKKEIVVLSTNCHNETRTECGHLRNNKLHNKIIHLKPLEFHCTCECNDQDLSNNITTLNHDIL